MQSERDTPRTMTRIVNHIDFQISNPQLFLMSLSTGPLEVARYTEYRTSLPACEASDKSARRPR